MPRTHPKQARLALNPETFRALLVPPRLSASAAFALSNEAAAAILLRDPARYGGEDALAVRWARAVTRKAGAKC